MLYCAVRMLLGDNPVQFRRIKREGEVVLSGKGRGLSQLAELLTGVGYAAARTRAMAAVRRLYGALLPGELPPESGTLSVMELTRGRNVPLLWCSNQ